MKKQQQIQQTTSYQPNHQSQQQTRAQIKPQPTSMLSQPIIVLISLNSFQTNECLILVGKKKDPNRFVSKEYSGLINDVDDVSWPKGQTTGSGWVGTTEDWDQETTEQDWGGPNDKNDTWPTVKSSNDTNSISNTSTVVSESSTTGLDTWDSECDDSIDLALDAADCKQVGPAGTVNWTSTGGLGGLIGTSSNNWDPGMGGLDKHGWKTSDSWSKTPGKGSKTKQEQDSTYRNTSNWGGTPADTSSVWIEHSMKTDQTWDIDNNCSQTNKTESNDQTRIDGWGDNPTSWGATSDITGTACWDNALNARKVTDIKDASTNKNWLDNSNITDKEDTNDASWDGWTTASKRNRVI